MNRFYLGTHLPHWLATAGVPLFVSNRRLAERMSLPEAIAPWALDSGGFSELSLYGEWRTSSAEYVAAVRRYRAEIGMLDWAAPQDWMCEPAMLVQTGKTIREHQRLTVENYLRLRDLAPDQPFIPVLQGWERDDYLYCVEMYAQAGIDLAALPLVGIGSVCRRQATTGMDSIVQELERAGIRLHGFGVKLDGLARYGVWLESSDSLAWSYGARREPPMDGHTHKNCANCMPWALQWRRKVLCSIRTPQQARMV